MTNSFSKLNDLVLKFVQKVGGLDKAIHFLEEVLLSKGDESLMDGEDIKRISDFINSTVADHFKTTVDDLKTKQSNDHPRYRTICYQFHKEFLSLSIRETMVIYGKKENVVMRGLHSMDDVLKKPALDPELYEAYVVIKTKIQKFNNYLSNEKETQA